MIQISKLKNNPNNPRTISKEQLDKLKRSIESFPEMMVKRPMVCVTDVDSKMYPLGGNMRLKAIKELGVKEIPNNWIMLADDWTEEQRKEFVIKDNANLGSWDIEALVDGWDIEELEEWGVDTSGWDDEEESTEEEQIDLSDDLDIAFKIEIDCENESEQEKLYNEFLNRGFKCRLLTL